MTKKYLLFFLKKQLKLSLIFSFLLVSVTTVSLYAQVAVQQPFEEQFNLWQENNFQEKIYVHTDKATYVTGEICWFKIYNVDAYNHHPADFGKVAYIEVLDKDNQAVLQAKTGLAKGVGNGSFFLPATLVTGNYTMRAYTNWMKNYGADYFFEKKMMIINVQKTAADTKANQKPLYDIGFFPEGGNLVNGIESKVGFKVNNQFGKGVNFDGLLLTDKGDTITSFSPLKFGMGSFIFKPAAGTQYKAIIKLPGDEQQTKMLPAAYSNGYTMQVQHTGNGQLNITVQSGDAGNVSQVYLFVHTRNAVKTVMNSPVQHGKAVFVISDTLPGDGISQFTIFNSKREPVCERLYFKKPLQQLAIKAQADKPVYSLRKPIKIDINTTIQNGQAVAADMSMAVYRLDSLATGDDCSITDYLLLSSDLTATVESPAYYFSNDNDTANAAADNLMLTQGWRRFNWDDVLKSRKPSFQFIPELYGHIITGKIIPLHADLPVKNIEVYLSVPGIRTQFYPANADANGNVKFDMKNFYSDGDIVIQTNNETDSGYRIETNAPFFSKFSGKLPGAYNATLQNAALQKRYVSTQIQNTYLYNRLNQPADVPTDTTPFYGKADASYLLDNYVRFTTLEEVFREYVMQVSVRKHGGKFVLPVIDEGARKPFTEAPLVLLDGVPVFDINKLMSYDPLKIRKLEVMSRKYFLRNTSFDGIINLITYTGDLEGFEIDSRAGIINYEGLQLQREFYSPVYATEKQQQSRLPDFRTLLFWTPQLTSDNSGKTQAVFYSSDLPGKYAAVIEGITPTGQPAETVTYFEVK